MVLSKQSCDGVHLQLDYLDLIGLSDISESDSPHDSVPLTWVTN